MLSSFSIGDVDEDITDIAYNSSGTRAALAIGVLVKIYEQVSGAWIHTATLPHTHIGVIYKVVWANDDFGNYIATCSDDRTIAIYEECLDTESKSASSVTWVRQTTLDDALDSVVHLAFSPKHIGFKLASCSLDGVLRIYDGFQNWENENSIRVAPADCSWCSWNPFPLDTPMILVAAADSAQVFEYVERSDRWYRQYILPTHHDTVTTCSWSTNRGRSHHTLATGDRSGFVRLFRYHPRGISNDGMSGPDCEIVQVFNQEQVLSPAQCAALAKQHNEQEEQQQHHQQQRLGIVGNVVALSSGSRTAADHQDHDFDDHHDDIFDPTQQSITIEPYNQYHPSLSISKVEFDQSGTMLMAADVEQCVRVFACNHDGVWAPTTMFSHI